MFSILLTPHRPAGVSVTHFGDRHDVFFISSRFGFCEEARLLLDHVPPVVMAHGDSEHAQMLRWAVQRLSWNAECMTTTMTRGSIQ